MNTVKIFRTKKSLLPQEIAEKLGLAVLRYGYDFINFVDQMPHKTTPNCDWATRFRVGILIDKKTFALCVFKNDPLYKKAREFANEIG